MPTSVSYAVKKMKEIGMRDLMFWMEARTSVDVSLISCLLVSSACVVYSVPVPRLQSLEGKAQ